MAFGKKKEKNKKKNREAAVKAQMVQMSQNPLYPEKQENTTKEVLTALGTAAACLILVGVITMNFSYAMGNAQAYDDTYVSEEQGEVTEETEEVQDEDITTGDYIIEGSDSRYISTSELEGLSAEELSYARNEIYARHGRKFKDEGLQNYFNSKDWYVGTIAPDDFSEGMLNDYEIKNAETILSYEKSKGYR